MAARPSSEHSPLLPAPEDTIVPTTQRPQSDVADIVQQDPPRRRDDEKFVRYMTIWAWVALPCWVLFTFYILLPIYAVAAGIRWRGLSTGGEKEFADEPRMYSPFILLISLIAWRVWATIWWMWPRGHRMVRALLVAVFWLLAVYALFYTGCYTVYPRNCGFGRQREHRPQDDWGK